MDIINIEDRNNRVWNYVKLEQLITKVIDVGFHIHETFGLGLLESLYQKVFSSSLRQIGLQVETEVPLKFSYNGIIFDSELRADMIIENSLVIELKSVETLVPVHKKQLLTYLKILDYPIELLVNFGSALYKNGVKRVVNNYTESRNFRG